METTSFKSPKNRFMAQITYSQPLTEIGSASTVTANSIDELKSRVNFYTEQVKRNNITSYIRISENLEDYPMFDWKEIENYNV